MKVLVTGIAGFIGFHVAKRLLTEGFAVVGIDNLNDYYDVQLKKDRLKELGISETNSVWISTDSSLTFLKIDLQEKGLLLNLFAENKFEYVIHLAAQAGVRYSLSEPQKYVDSNITGFLNILECCREYPVKNLLYASSSSVYGLNDKTPFSELDRTDSPISMYAATKKANELMAHTYSYLFNIPSTGLRFFTVYGPWSRPDMAMFLFTKAILDKEPIKVFNNGNMYRDFTFITDIVDGVFSLLNKRRDSLCEVFNIGRGEPIGLMTFIEEIERQLNVKALIDFQPMQDGDVFQTYCSTEKLKICVNYESSISVGEGVSNFLGWYKKYYKVD